MRIRTIKPEFWLHEGLSRCSDFARLLAIALLNWADDEGYFMANPILIRGQVFPFLDDSRTIPRGLQELSSVGFIRLGEDHEGRAVGFIVNFRKHQRVDKPKPSNIKENAKFQDESKTIPRRILDASKEEGKGREWKGKERKDIVLSDSSDLADCDEIAKIWQGVPKASRERSSVPQLRTQWARLKPSERPSSETLMAAIAAWNASQKWADGYAEGCHIWVRNRQWENLPAPAMRPPANGGQSRLTLEQLIGGRESHIVDMTGKSHTPENDFKGHPDAPQADVRPMGAKLI